MPLPGGPSSKLGNRYELKWTVQQIVEVILGKYDSIRLEPPGEDAIEFRCQRGVASEVHQVKRTKSSRGHWNLSDLKSVLQSFDELLSKDLKLTCIFVSEQDAASLREITNRARDAADLSEFLSSFLTSASTNEAWKTIQDEWQTSPTDTHERLQRIHVIPIGEDPLTRNIDVVLGLMFDARPNVIRPVIADLALESVHKTLTATMILAHLEEAGIRSHPQRSADSFSFTTAPPPSHGIIRSSEIARIVTTIAEGRRTILLTGIPGTGKSTLARQACAEWKGNVCWLDCGLINSLPEACAAFSDFLNSINETQVAAHFLSGQAKVESLSKLAGRAISQHNTLLVWDGLEPHSQQSVLKFIEGIATSMEAGAQILTSQSCDVRLTPGRMEQIVLDRLSQESVRSLLIEAFPDARLPDLEAADELTHGHPQLLHLLTGLANRVDLRTALETSNPETDGFLAEILQELDENSLFFLKNAAYLGLPFRAVNLDGLGGTKQLLSELVSRNLISRLRTDFYLIQDMIAEAVTKSITSDESVEYHKRVAVYLRSLERPSWLEIRALLNHALAASLSNIAKDAGNELIEFGMRHANWGLVQTAAAGLIQVLETKDTFFPYFVLGKYHRLQGALEPALHHYSKAVEVGQTSNLAVAGAQLECAAVLCNLERRDEAQEIYLELGMHSDPATRCMATTSLALGVLAERGEFEEAVRLLGEAAEIARSKGLVREEAEAAQALGQVLIWEERLEEAHDALEQAHRLRHSIKNHSADTYGWYFLFLLILKVESGLCDAEGARQAAHCLWRFAALSTNIKWEAEAAFALCNHETNREDAEIVTALNRLVNIGRSAFEPPKIRRDALTGLLICSWILERYEDAAEAMLEVLALGNEYNQETPLILNRRAAEDSQESVVEFPGGYILLTPSSENEDFMLDLATRVIGKRPELGQYARVIKGANIPDTSNTLR